jgi:hypothetical protein
VFAEDAVTILPRMRRYADAEVRKALAERGAGMAAAMDAMPPRKP